MGYKFDNFGWYVGVSDGDRTTDVAPLNTSTLETLGAPRANFTGYVWINLPYTPPPSVNIDLAALKAAKNAEINNWRLAATFSTFIHSGKVFSCDQLSRSDIDGINGYAALYGALPAAWPGAWKATDNTFFPIGDIAGWKAFYTSMVGAGSANFDHSQALKLALSEATTPDQIAAIIW